MLVEIPEPFSFELTTERFRTFGADPAAVWEAGRLHRVFDGVEVAIAPAPHGVAVEPAGASVAAAVRRFLGASFDLDALAAFAAADPVLHRLVGALRGLRPALVPDPFEMLVGSVTAQQVSLRAATAIRARLVTRFGTRLGRAHAFPTRERLAAADASELAAAGFSRRKAESVVALARSSLDLDALAALPDDEVKERITALAGFGEWSADWFLARHLGRPNAWPAGDLALRKAVSALYLDGREATIADVRAFGERFGEHRNLAAHYLLAGHRVLRG